MRAPGSSRTGHPGLRRDIVLLLAIKAAVLILLWYLFFSPAHRMHVDGNTTGQHFSLSAPPGERPAAQRSGHAEGEP